MLIKNAYDFDPNMIPPNSSLALELTDNINNEFEKSHMDMFGLRVPTPQFARRKKEIISNAVPVAGQARRDYAREIGSAYDLALNNLRDNDIKLWLNNAKLTPEQLASAILASGKSMGADLRTRHRQFLDVENGRQMLMNSVKNPIKRNYLANIKFRFLRTPEELAAEKVNPKAMADYSRSKATIRFHVGNHPLLWGQSSIHEGAHGLITLLDATPENKELLNTWQNPINTLNNELRAINTTDLVMRSHMNQLPKRLKAWQREQYMLGAQHPNYAMTLHERANTPIQEKYVLQKKQLENFIANHGELDHAAINKLIAYINRQNKINIGNVLNIRPARDIYAEYANMTPNEAFNSNKVNPSNSLLDYYMQRMNSKTGFNQLIRQQYVNNLDAIRNSIAVQKAHNRNERKQQRQKYSRPVWQAKRLALGKTASYYPLYKLYI